MASGYGEAELLGQPHSVIRHPDTPRAIFKLLWERIQAGREIFGYVKNLTKTGDFYWVLAHITPSVSASGEILGYHSNRRVPDRRIVDDIILLYRSLKHIEDGEADRRAGLARSTDQLASLLKDKALIMTNSSSAFRLFVAGIAVLASGSLGAAAFAAGASAVIVGESFAAAICAVGLLAFAGRSRPASGEAIHRALIVCKQIQAGNFRGAHHGHPRDRRGRRTALGDQRCDRPFGCVSAQIGGGDGSCGAQPVLSSHHRDQHGRRLPGEQPAHQFGGRF